MYIKSVTKYYRVALLAVIIILSPIFISAQLSYTIERINTEKGLPTNAIKGLQFDSKNRFLWVATESGIVRYNGHSFQNFGDETKNEKLNGRIVFFEKAEDGTLFGKLMDESVFKIENNKVYIDNKIPKISWQHQFIAFKYNLPPIKLNGITSLTDYFDFKLDNKIYFITDNRIKRFENAKLDTLVTLKNGEQGFKLNQRWFLINIKGAIQEVKHDKYFNLLITDFNKNIFEVFSKNANKGNIKVFQNHPSEPAFLIRDNKLFQLIWVDQQIIPLLITDKIPINEIIRYVQMDMITKTIYLGTDNRGLLVANPQYFNRVLPISKIEGVSASSYAQVELNNGNIQINSGQVFGNSKIKTNLIFNQFSETNTYLDSDSILYFINKNGINEYSFKDNKYLKEGGFNEIDKKTNSTSFIEAYGNIYSFSSSGISIKQKNANWQSKLNFKKTPYNFIIYQLSKINTYEILAATTDGLYKYNILTNQFKLFYRDKSSANFRSIYHLGAYLLIGTYGGGVYMYKSDTIKQVPLDPNGYLKFTHCFIEDNNERIWASTNKGIFMATKKSLIDFWHNGPGKIVYKYYGKSEGIDILELNGGCSPCAIKLKSGYFSFPGIDGLIQFNPNDIIDLNIVPKVYIDKVFIDEKIINYNEAQNLNSKTSKILIQLGISGMLSQENIRLEYKIDDDKNWSAISINNPILTIDKPSYGAHKVSVRLRSTFNAKWEYANFDFNIVYPWFLNPWMYFIYLLGMFGLVLLYIRFKTLIYQRRQKILESEVAVKTATLNELNDYLQKRNQAKDHVIAIMNHDILTPLKYLHITAKNTSDQISEQKVKQSIIQIAKTSKELEYLTSNMLNWVKFDNIESLPNPQQIDLYQLVQDLIEFVEPFKEFPKVEIVNELPADTMIQGWPDSLRVLLYNILINAVKSTRQGFIKVQFFHYDDHFTLQVIDSGEGMSASMVQYLITGTSKDAVELLPKYKKGNGIGYQIIRHLVKLMEAELSIESKEGVGSTITIIFYKTNFK
jgi:signal transduction histidine kinase